MSFQIKDFNSITLSQINHARAVTTRVTDFQPGSVVRTLMESASVEIEELYLQMLLGLRDAIPVATFRSFGFDTLPARVAMGFVSVSKSTPPAFAVVVDSGTRFSTSDGRIYASTQAVTWPAGQSLVRIPVTSLTAGAIGNVAAGVITQSDTFGSLFTVGNALIETGADAETGAEREERFAEFIAALSRGTLQACLYAARQSRVLDADGNIAEYVTRIGVSESPGYVALYVYGSNGAPSHTLLSDGQERMDGSRDDTAGTITPGFRPAGVSIDILPMVERAVALSIQVGMLPGQALTIVTTQRLGDIYASVIGAIRTGTTLYLGMLIEALLAVPGVASIVPVTTSNITCSTTETLTAGPLTIAPL